MPGTFVWLLQGSAEEDLELGLALAAALHGGGDEGQGRVRRERSHRPQSDGASSTRSSVNARDSTMR